MNDWTYDNKLFDPSEEFLKDHVGFVYIITESSTGMKYIGKKLFWSARILPITKKRKRRKRTTVESDWRDYYSSNKTLQENALVCGPGEYTREILHLCKSKGEASYIEAMEQFNRGVLLRDDYYNGIINCRINAKHLNRIDNSILEKLMGNHYTKDNDE